MFKTPDNTRATAGMLTMAGLVVLGWLGGCPFHALLPGALFGASMWQLYEWLRAEPVRHWWRLSYLFPSVLAICLCLVWVLQAIQW